MFAASLLPHPPPSMFLLPPLSQSNTDSIQQSHIHPQSRRKSTNRTNGLLASLSQDERLVASRKLAIAMYGYSWLKPAGCTKTMLGRREEELEREEVERQLREVELQERIAMEQEEQERREELRRQADGAEIVDEVNLDNDIPDADEDGEQDSDGSAEGAEDDDEDDDEGAEEDLDDNGVDLDDEIPEAETDDTESSWVYDTRREPDTESEDEQHESHPRQPRHAHFQPSNRPHYAGEDDVAATELMVSAMLEEDELGDMEVDMDADLSDRDLDDDVPPADDEPGWEHTDSELEESEMDISLLPPHPNSTSRNPGTTHEEMRRVSGNMMLPPPLPPPQPPSSQSRRVDPRMWRARRNEAPAPTTAPRPHLRTAMIQTPGTADDISALISTGGTSALETGPSAADATTSPRSPNRRTWLNPAGARRNLFGGFRGTSTTTTTTIPTTTTVDQPPSAPTMSLGPAAGPSRIAASSGGLFTPSPRHGTGDGSDGDSEGRTQQTMEPPRSRTRSGRLLGGLQVGRRARRDREGAT